MIGKRTFIVAILLLFVAPSLFAQATQSTTKSGKITSRRFQNQEIKNAIEERLFQAQGTAVASAATLDFDANQGNFFKVTGTAQIDSIVAESAGYILYMVMAAADTVLDGKNLKLAGNFNATADDVIVLISDGTNWYEVSRSAN